MGDSQKGEQMNAIPTPEAATRTFVAIFKPHK